jgi:predicted anti-sigma-YlaC factor YlaD
MDCKKCEKSILRALDGRITSHEKKELDEHLQKCPLCSAAQEEYKVILNTLKERDFPEPKPYFEERLKAKLKERKASEPWTVWKRWGIRTIPVSLVLILLFGAAILLLSPQEGAELSQSEALLRELNPLEETSALLNRESFVDKSMELIFTAEENNNGSNNDTRRYQP